MMKFRFEIQKVGFQNYKLFCVKVGKELVFLAQGGSVNLINLRNYPGNTFFDVKSVCDADSGLVLV